MDYEKERRSLNRHRCWQIATGIPLATIALGLGFCMEGWEAAALIMMGTYVAIRTFDMICEGAL